MNDHERNILAALYAARGKVTRLRLPSWKTDEAIHDAEIAARQRLVDIGYIRCHSGRFDAFSLLHAGYNAYLRDVPDVVAWDWETRKTDADRLAEELRVLRGRRGLRVISAKTGIPIRTLHRAELGKEEPAEIRSMIDLIRALTD